ncbi:response regulator transcription factor [Streptomyces sp. NPDC088348]|uniref:response regulator transcription factor n=1 Tax=Streptomyces sp. NPDC088348 TaxID=3365853 RepID=UPI0037F18E17
MAVRTRRQPSGTDRFAQPTTKEINMNGALPRPTADLSAREAEVLRHMALGRTYTAIARSMSISPHTVDAYVRRIRLKTGVTNRAQLLLLAIRLGDVNVHTTGDI